MESVHVNSKIVTGRLIEQLACAQLFFSQMSDSEDVGEANGVLQQTRDHHWRCISDHEPDLLEHIILMI